MQPPSPSSSRSTPAPPASAAFAIDPDGTPVGRSYREFTQHFPRPGWVEHDAAEIWDTTRTVLAELIEQLDRPGARRRRHRPARDRGGVGPPDRGSPGPGDRVAGPTHRRTLRRAGRGGRARTGAPPDRPGARSVLLGVEDGVAVATRRRRRGRAPGVRHDRQLAGVEPHRRRQSRHRSVQREPHDALRHLRAPLVRRALRPVRRPDGGPAPGPAVGRRVRSHRRRHRACPPASPSRASQGTSRPRCSARPASTRAWPRTPTAPGRSC